MELSKVAKDAESLAARGQVAEAYALLDRAVHAGDAAAAFTLAMWRLTGQHIRRDLGLSRDLFGRAADGGVQEARPIHIALLANGAGGGPRQWDKALGELRSLARAEPLAARQLALIESMAITAEGEPAEIPPSRTLNSAPRIVVWDQFLATGECEYLIDLAGPRLTASVVVDRATGNMVRDPVRTSRAAGFPFISEDPVLHAINRRIAAATGTIYEQGEPLQILSYDPGQEFKLHSDALGSGENQRILTLLVYLNEGFEGGDTYFPDLDLSFRGRTGDAILFANVDASGEPEPRARHAGRPVTSGRKMLLSKWIRSAPLDLSGPPGRPF